MLLLLGTLVLFLTKVTAQGPPPADEPKYIATITSCIMLCDDDKSKDALDPSGLITDMPNATMSYIDGEVKFLMPITNENTAELTLIKEQGGQSKMVMSVCMNMCDELMNPESDYAFILKYFEVGDECPFKEGAYKLNYMVLELDDMPINSSNEGCYTAKISLFKGNGACDDNAKEFLGCIYMTFNIEPAE